MEKRRYSTFAVIFYTNKSKVKKNGLCPIMGRISINGEVAQFSAKLEVAPNHWDAKKYIVKGRSKEAKYTNRELERLTDSINILYKKIVDEQGYVTAELLKNTLMGVGVRKERLLELLREHNEEYKLKIGVSVVAHSFVRYKRTYELLTSFLNERYGAKDIALKQLKYPFIEDFDFYLRTEKRFVNSTIANFIICLKKIIRRAMHQGTLLRDPFMGFHPTPTPKKCRHMSSEELEKMINTSIESKLLCHTRDMFLFSCFTGISFSDLRNLTMDNISYKSGTMWINLKRQKTGSNCSILVLDIAKQIFDKYNSERTSNKVFNICSYTNIRIKLKKVAQLCGIESNISYHQSRHNFATIVALSNGLPLESVSKIMGHKGIKTTQIYAHITNKKLNDDMRQLTNTVEDRYTSMYNETITNPTNNNKHNEKRKYNNNK